MIRVLTSHSPEAHPGSTSRPDACIPRRRAVRALILLAVTIPLVGTGCASEVANNGGDAFPKEIRLAVEQGVVFSVGDVVAGASYLKVDLVVHKHGSSNFDIKGGGSGPSDRMYMNTFKTGGVRKTFASLADVPSTLPGTSNFGEYLNSVKTGDGFVVANNIGDGHTKVWVKQVIGAAGQIVLEYEPVAD